MQSSRLGYFALLILFFANFLNGFDRQVIAVLAVPLKDYWRLSDVQTGLLATAFEIAYSLSAVPIAVFSDRWFRNRIIALVVFVWSGAMAVTGFAPSFAIIVLGRALLGLGQAGYGSSANAWLCEIFPQQRLARMASLHELGLVLGTAAAFGLGSVLSTILGWRPVFYFAAIPGVIVAIVLWLLQIAPNSKSDNDSIRQLKNHHILERGSLVQQIRELARKRTLWISCVVGTLMTFSGSAILFWFPTFGVRVHQMDQQTAGVVIGLIAVLSGIAGVLSAGYLADYLLRYYPGGRLLLIGVSALVGTPIALVAVLANDDTLFLVFTALSVYLFSFYVPSLGPLLTQVTGRNQRATSIAIYLFITHIVGFAGGPPTVGWVSDQTGSLRLGLALLPIIAAIAALIGLWGSRFVKADVVGAEHQSSGSSNQLR